MNCPRKFYETFIYLNTDDLVASDTKHITEKRCILCHNNVNIDIFNKEEKYFECQVLLLSLLSQ